MRFSEASKDTSLLQVCFNLGVLVLNVLSLFGDSMEFSLPSSSVHEIFQARVLECVAFSSSRGSSWSRDWTHVLCVSCIAGGFFTRWAISWDDCWAELLSSVMWIEIQLRGKRRKPHTPQNPMCTIKLLPRKPRKQTLLKLMAAAGSTGSEKRSATAAIRKRLEYQLIEMTLRNGCIFATVFWFYVYLILYWWIIYLGMRWVKIPRWVGCLLFWGKNPKTAGRGLAHWACRWYFGNMSVGGSLGTCAFTSRKLGHSAGQEGPVDSWKSPCAEQLRSCLSGMPVKSEVIFEKDLTVRVCTASLVSKLHQKKVSLQVFSRVIQHVYLNTHTHTHTHTHTQRQGCTQVPAALRHKRTQKWWFGCVLTGVLALCQSWLTIIHPPPKFPKNFEFPMDLSFSLCVC